MVMFWWLVLSSQNVRPYSIFIGLPVNKTSRYSMAANSMMHRCSCCQELRTSSKQVEMKCPDQRHITHTYTYVEECGCHVTECKDKKSSGY
ncbi:hypothetical protein AOLI_G00177370 [Acnodon oligacanthus]